VTNQEATRRDTLLWRAGLGFIVLTLGALVLVPGFVNRRVAEVQEENAAAQVARTQAMRLQMLLVREMMSLNELLLGGDVEYRARYRVALENERALFAELEPHAAQLGPRVEAALDEARRKSEAWHARIADTAVVRLGPGASDDGELLRETDLFEQAMDATARLDGAILQAMSANRDRIRGIEMTGMTVTFGLGLLAFLAALAAANLHRRVSRYAQESDRQRRQAERALELTARATEARTRLLRGVTHDVKNPLGAAKGYAELLGLGVKGPLAQDQRDYLDKIQRSLDSALAIIADLLDVARADSGALQIHPQPTVLDDTASDAADVHRAVAEAAGHALLVERRCEGVVLRSDPKRIQQVLGNLLSNAIKYTPRGGTIVVRTEIVEGRRGPGDGPWATVEVEDTGPGVPPELRESIFDEFTRVEDGSQIKGHGLGLAIARRVARLLGGELTCGDAPTGGAVFTLWLPVVPATAEELTAV
jgi:signal transduction histidine kinase